ncbi:MAG: MBL fold metallo-hydrolase, partial [Acidobacteria bacterium]|nr:MBL fold metallo-hydrolase [Acidobacteriota bacterium]
EQGIIVDAVAALGGDRIARATSFSLQAEGTHFNLGQDVTPGAASQTFSVTRYARVLDWSTGQSRMRVEQTRTPNFAYFQGNAPQTQTFGLDGDVAYTLLANGNAVRASETVAGERRAETYHHPVAVLRAALQPGARLSNVRTEGPERLVDMTTTDNVALTLAIDATSSQPTRVTLRSYQANLGDIVISSRFFEYQDVDGLKLPSRLTTSLDDFMTADLRVKTQVLDAAVGDLAAPASITAAPAGPGPSAPIVVTEEVAPGVWLLAGQSHHSAVVELSDHLLLIEAPQSEARTLAVIAAARALRPDKPLTELVVSHHHFDHSAGLRAAVSEGLAVIAHAGNAGFIEEMVKRPHTIVADALAKKPATLTLQTVDDARTISDRAMSIVLYPISGNPHSHTMLMAYLPKQRLLVQADAFSPGSDIQPYAANLVENIKKRNLQVDRIVPLHGTIVPYTELLKVVSAGSS